MNVDLSFFLVLGVAFTGAMWAGHRILVARHGGALAGAPVVETEPRIVEASRVLFPVVLLVLVVRSFVFEPYRIPSPSMLPTLHVGDYILVSKSAYGLRLPVVNWRLPGGGGPERGDVVVFRLPADPSINYIKRVVGLPGDRIFYRNRELSVNGERVALVYATRQDDSETEAATEFLSPRGHGVLFNEGSRHATVELTVPLGHYFVMGDNRDNSQDSRSPGVGFVPAANLVGKAVMVWLNTGDLDRAGDRII